MSGGFLSGRAAESAWPVHRANFAMSFFSSSSLGRLAGVRGLATCGCMAAGMLLAAPLGARALGFDWYFSDSSTGAISRGAITGLVEGYNPGGAGEVVQVVDTPLILALGGGWTFNSSSSAPFAFNVVNGVVVAADALYERIAAGGLQQYVGFGLVGPGSGNTVWSASIGADTSAPYLKGYPTVFTAAAPAPLPIVGAAVALGYGRRLRSRVRAVRRQSDVAPIA